MSPISVCSTSNWEKPSPLNPQDANEVISNELEGSKWKGLNNYGWPTIDVALAATYKAFSRTVTPDRRSNRRVITKIQYAETLKYPLMSQSDDLLKFFMRNSQKCIQTTATNYSIVT